MSNHVPDHVLRRIRACLRLAQSSNANEAAAALCRAQELAQQHEVDLSSVSLEDIEQVRRCAARRTPKQYEVALVNTVRDAFGVAVIRSGDDYVWIGPAHRVVIADYAYNVLARSLARARAAFIATLSKRIKRSSKIRRGDVFCLAWVVTVHETVVTFAMTSAERDATTEVIRRDFPLTRTNHIQAGKLPSRGFFEAYGAGNRAARGVSIHAGVDESERPKAIESGVV